MSEKLKSSIELASWKQKVIIIEGKFIKEFQWPIRLIKFLFILTNFQPTLNSSKLFLISIFM